MAMDGPLALLKMLALRCSLRLPLIGGSLVAALAITVGVSAQAQQAIEASPVSEQEAPRITGLIRDPRLREISGIAVSRRHPGLLWVHNDSGHPAQAHAIDERGQHRATLDIQGVSGRDFEDMSAFELDGVPYLLIADIGDNGGVRNELELVVLAEPERIENARITPAWTQRFRWPDGARDAEAVAVDVAAREILLISKKRVPPELFSLPLGPAQGLQTARRLGVLTGIEQPSLAELAGNPRFGRYRAQITSADLSADGRRLAVLNYRSAYLYQRDAHEAWSAAVTRPPVALPFGWLAQAEAIAFDSGAGSLWITSERLPAPLIRLPVIPAHQ